MRGVELAAKLQIKPGMQVAALDVPAGWPEVSALGPQAADPDSAGAVIVFVQRAAELEQAAASAVEAARQDRLAWIAYPKAGQLGTDLNRDSLARAMIDRGVHAVPQISLDDVWSALRFRPV
jgi:hypothetical protein